MLRYLVSKRSLALSALLFLFLLVRLSLVFYSAHVYMCEELKQVSLGIDILRGCLQLPFWCYLDSPHAGGSIFTGLFLIPFLLIFGKNYLAVKMAALTYSLITFLLVCISMRKYYAVRSVFFPLLLFFIFSTPHYLQKSLFLTGNTVELICIGFLFMWLVERIVINQREEKFSYMMLGILAGLGLWVQYLFVVFIITFIIFWIFHKGLSIFKYDFWQFCAGFGLGLLPWIIYNLIYGFPSIYADARVSSILFSKSMGLSSGGFYKLCNLIWVDVPRSFHFVYLSRISPQLIAYSFYFLFWISIIFLSLIKSVDSKKKKFIFLWITLFFVSVLSFWLLPLPIGNQGSGWGSLHEHFEFYLIFLQPVMFVIMSVAYAEFSKRKTFAVVRWVYYLLLPLMVLQFLQLVDYSAINQKAGMDFSALRPEANAYESGSNFILIPSIWKKALDQIEEESLREAYLRGSADTWSVDFPRYSRAKLTKYLSLEFSYLSEKEKAAFLEYIDEFSLLRNNNSQ